MFVSQERINFRNKEFDFKKSFATMDLLFAIWRPRLLRLVRGFRFFWEKDLRKYTLYFFEMGFGHFSHSSMKSFYTESTNLSQIHTSFNTSHNIRDAKRMFFFTRSEWYPQKHILTEFSEN